MDDRGVDSGAGGPALIASDNSMHLLYNVNFHGQTRTYGITWLPASCWAIYPQPGIPCLSRHLNPDIAVLPSSPPDLEADLLPYTQTSL